MYCSTVGWAETFHEAWELEEHMLSGKLSIPDEISLIGQVFTERMKLTAQQHHPSSSSTSTNPEGMVSKVYKNFFQQQRWALPVRN